MYPLRFLARIYQDTWHVVFRNETFSDALPALICRVYASPQDTGSFFWVSRNSPVDPSMVQAADIEPKVGVVHGPEICVRFCVSRIPLEIWKTFHDARLSGAPMASGVFTLFPSPSIQTAEGRESVEGEGFNLSTAHSALLRWGRLARTIAQRYQSTPLQRELQH